jgi:hypothetical protein
LLKDWRRALRPRTGMDYDGTFVASESRPFKFTSSPGLPGLEPPRREPCRTAAFALVSPVADSLAGYLCFPKDSDRSALETQRDGSDFSDEGLDSRLP